MTTDDQTKSLPESVEERLSALREGLFLDAALTPGEIRDVADQLLADLDNPDGEAEAP